MQQSFVGNDNTPECCELLHFLLFCVSFLADDNALECDNNDFNEVALESQPETVKPMVSC